MGESTLDDGIALHSVGARVVSLAGVALLVGGGTALGASVPPTSGPAPASSEPPAPENSPPSGPRILLTNDDGWSAVEALTPVLTGLIVTPG